MPGAEAVPIGGAVSQSFSLGQADQFQANRTLFIVGLQGNGIGGVQCHFVDQTVGVEKRNINQTPWRSDAALSFHSGAYIAASAVYSYLTALSSEERRFGKDLCSMLSRYYCISL